MFPLESAEQITYSLQSDLLGLRKRPTVLQTNGVGFIVMGFAVVSFVVGLTVVLTVCFIVVLIVGFNVVGAFGVTVVGG